MGPWHRIIAVREKTALTDSDEANLFELDNNSEAPPRSFAPGEMITCEACLRSNPPTRATCIYCAAKLASTEDKGLTAQPPVQADTGDAYHVVLAPDQNADMTQSTLAGISSLTRLKISDLENIIRIGQPFPIACVATSEQAAVLADKLHELGTDGITVANDSLNPGVPTRKIRALEFSDESVAAIALSDSRKISARWEDVVLLVSGRLVVNRVEVEERRRRGRSQPLGARELFSDESVVDLYTSQDEGNWRIAANSFDFSCLGESKAVTTFENFAALINLLRQRASNAQFDNSYMQLKPALSTVWPLEPQTRKGEWRRSGAGKLDMSTVTTTENEAQFTQYSRLRYCLRLRGLEGR